MSTNLQVPIQKYAQPVSVPTPVRDNNSPYSYKEWIKIHQGIIPGQEYKQYNTYLIDWYKQKSSESTDNKIQLKLNYLTLLKQLQLFFTKEEAENWYNNINIENEKELLLAVPYFARKLKEISLYYLKLRENIKQSRLLYNQIGTNSSIVEQIQDIITSNFTKKDNKITTVPFSIWSHIPELSSITNTFTIQIEELYDKQNYLDKSPTVPLSDYFNIDNTELFNFLNTKGLLLTSTDWIFKGGIFPLSANYINLSSEDITALINDAATKYLGQDKLITIQNLTSSIQTDFYTIFVVTGDNYFLWPGTPYLSKAKALPIYKPVSLQDLDIKDLATGGSDLSTSDKIFVKTVKGIEGAWLASQPIEFSTENMNAVFDANSKTAFKFPYPGYGLSAEGYNWTGASLTANPQFFYLDNIVKQNIENEYWSATIDTVSSSPININDTTLIDSKAYPNSNYNAADKVIVRSVPPAYIATNYFNENKEAWLYRMNQTDISIRGNSDNIIYWPYQRIDQTEPYPTYFPNNPSNVCTPLSISAINLPFATAGDSLQNADVIYKISNYLETSATATECCWLSSSPVSFSKIEAFTSKQNSFQGIYIPGIYIKFLWQGKNNTDVDTVFKSLKHQPDCEYITKNSTYQNPETCTCNQVLFTPFGHPGEKFTDYNSLADYILEDNSMFSQIDTGVIPASSFCWFKTNSLQGWGDGRWVTTNTTTNNKFYLQTGKIYAYYRATQQGSNFNLDYPPLVVRYDFNTYNNNYENTHKWIRAYKDIDGNWISSNESSKMIVSPGDLLLYSRTGTTSYTLTSLVPLSSYVSENRGSAWSSVDYLTINDGSVDAFNQSFTLNWPAQTYIQTPGSQPSQYPAFGSEYLLNIKKWTVRHVETNTIYEYNDTLSVTIVPTLTGTYEVQVIAVSSNTSNVLLPTISSSAQLLALPGNYIFTNIPKITAISPISYNPSLTSYPIPLPGFVLSTPLKGWDYNLNAPATPVSFQNVGAKPYWAKTNNTYKGYNFTGAAPRLLDFYNVVYQPEISDISFNLGQYVEYVRNYPADLNWVQPLTLATQKNLKQWCTIQIQTTSSNLDSNFSDTILIPTLSESNIILQNFVNNEPVEIYYKAQQPFIWQISAVPEINTPQFPSVSSAIGISSRFSWANLTNLEHPTFAVFPTLDQFYSATDSGGYFTPNYLGASKYINQNYTVTTNASSNKSVGYFSDPQKTVFTRGFTQEDQDSPYEIANNNTWVKEPFITTPIAGTVNKKIFKKYQKFIPYQSKYETNPYIKQGLVLPNSRQTPWGGKNDSEWTDLNNFPVSPTGEINVKKWADSQILKQTSLQLDNWVTDIFGNQYGLYKDYTNIEPIDRKNINGILWVRTNKQNVAPATTALNRVFDTYKKTSIINELTGFGIRKIETFYDTLYVETSGAIIFEKLNYDYDTDTIFSTTDDARFISLAEPVSLNFDKEFVNTDLSEYRYATVGDTWFFSDLKKVLINVNSFDFIPTNEYKSTYSWELTTSNTTTYTLSGTIPLPNNSQSYIVSVGGVIQPYTTYTIASATREITFSTSLPNNTSIYVLLLYNPTVIDEYDHLPTQTVTTSPVLTSKFLLNNFPNLTPSEGQYIVTVDGILQRPKNLANDLITTENSYTITTTPPAIEFSEPVQPGLPITVTRLPQHKKCISPSLFYTWVYAFPIPTKTITLNSGPRVTADPAAYIVNVGGVLQSPSDFTINPAAKTITFVEPIPANTFISITQMSVPQLSIPQISLYELDLNTQILKQIFPITAEHITALDELKELRLVEVTSASLSYNSVKNELLVTALAKNCIEEDIILEIILTYNPIVEIKSFTVYQSIPQSIITVPPIINSNLYTALSVTSFSQNDLNITYQVSNGLAEFVPVNLPNWVNLTSNGTFSGTPPKLTSSYNAEFYVQNSAGSTYYNFLIDVIMLNI